VGGRQARHPFRQRRVGIGFAHEDKIQPLAADGFTQRLLTVQVIAQDRNAQSTVLGSELAEPTFGRGVLTVLLAVAILGGDKFRLQGDHPRIVRGATGSVLYFRPSVPVFPQGGMRGHGVSSLRPRGQFFTLHRLGAKVI
jgi:hypothetical protein